MEANPQKRADPRPRTNNPGLPGQLRNGRPDRAYLLANPSDDRFGLAMHLDSGWSKVMTSGGGKDGDKERVHSGRIESDGSVTYQGQVLIWLDREEYDRREKTKQSLVKARDARKLAPGGPDGIVNTEGKPASNWEPKD